ncbi:MAG: peptide ABC transporter substrate-binding protein [Erysipelotrichaceae bacterium]
MKMFKKFLIISLVLLLMAGCGGSGDTAGTNDDNVVIANETDIASMDLHIATDGTSFEAITLGFAGLTELSSSNEPLADMASNWDVSDDGKVYTFYLADTNWSNGTPVTAHDFVYAWKRLVSEETASEYSFIMGVVDVVNANEILAGNASVDELGVKALDDKTFEVTLNKPVDFFLGLMAFPSFFPLNEEFVESQGDQYALTAENMIYNGPYVMESWTPGSDYSFVLNDQYYKADTINTKKVSFRFVQDTQTAMLEYQSGNIDLVKLTGEMVDAYGSDEGFNNVLQGFLWYLSLNFEVVELQNHNLRMAISYAVDRETIANSVLKDGSVPAEGIVPRALAIGPTGNDFRDDSGVLIAYDPSKAASYYQAAVAELGGDVNIELLFEDTESSKAVAEYIQSNLEENLPGISVTLNSKPKKTRLDLQQNGEYQMALHRWGPDYADPQTYLDLFLKDSVSNYGNYDSEKYTSLVNEGTNGASASDSDARWQLLLDAEKTLISEDMAVVPVYQNGGAYMINPKLSGFEFHSAGVNNFRHIKFD